MSTRFPADSTVVVTGAAGGIGGAVVRRLVDRGLTVVPADLRADTGAGIVACDVTDRDDVDRLFHEVVVRHGRVSHVVHAAGVLRTGRATEQSGDAVELMVRVNLLGTINVLSAAARCMLEAGSGGSLVAVTSNAARVPRVGMAAYAATKSAAEQFTRSLGLELAPSGIRANCVAPGSTYTPMLEEMWAGADLTREVVAGSLDDFKPGIPLRRIGEATDVADLVEFLLSEDARHLTLQSVTVDGGAALGC